MRRMPFVRRPRTVLGLIASTALVGVLASIGTQAQAQTRTGLPSTVVASVALGTNVTSPLSTGQLFGPQTVLVPGDTATASFTVQNASKDPALLSLALNGASAADPALLNMLTVKAAVPGSTGTRGAALGSAKSCPMLIRDTPVSAGGSVTVKVSISLAASVTGLQNATELSTFDFLANLRQAGSFTAATTLQCSGTVSGTPKLDGGTPLYRLGAPTTAPGKKSTKPTAQGTSGSGGGLAWTGVNVLAILIVGVALAGGGVGLLIAARRRRERENVPYDFPGRGRCRDR